MLPRKLTKTLLVSLIFLVYHSRAATYVFRNTLFVFLVPWIKIGVLYVFQPAKAESGVYFDLKLAD